LHLLYIFFALGFNWRYCKQLGLVVVAVWLAAGMVLAGSISFSTAIAGLVDIANKRAGIRRKMLDLVFL